MKDYCKILAYVIFAEILTLFINLTLAVSSSALFKIICSVCTVGILAGLMAQAGYSIGVTDRKRRKKHPETFKPLRALWLGLTAMLPYQLCWVLLLLAKLGIVVDSFYRMYKLLCAPFLQICNLFQADVSAAGVPAAELCVLQLLCWIPLIAVVIAYRMTLQGKAVEEMMYE